MGRENDIKFKISIFLHISFLFLIKQKLFLAEYQWVEVVLWTIMMGYYYFFSFRLHISGKIKYSSLVSNFAFQIAAFYILFNVLIGLGEGFGLSPYDHSFKGIIVNLLLVGIPLIGWELIRDYLANTYARKEQWLPIIGIVLLMTFTEIPLRQFIGISDIQSLTIFSAQTLLPGLSSNLLCTYLVLYGGPWASITYLGMIEAYEWLMPILPNFDWLAKGIIGMGVPLVGWMYLTQSYNKLIKRVKSYREPQENIWSMVGTGVFCVGLIWFTVGVFPVYPSAIATGSMEPGIKPGDVVLINKITTEEELRTLEIGDVIQFQREDILISHRIVEIIEEEGIPYYRTKGDNNSSEDYRLVEAEEVKGRIVGCVPKVGWPTLVFRSHDSAVLEEVEF